MPRNSIYTTKQITALACVKPLHDWCKRIQSVFNSANIDGSFTMADSNSFFESLGNSSNSLRKHMFRNILWNFSDFIMKFHVMCTH